MGTLNHKDPVWTGICLLVFTQAGSDWFLGCMGIIFKTDPVLAGLCVVTGVHFIGIYIDGVRK